MTATTVEDVGDERHSRGRLTKTWLCGPPTEFCRAPGRLSWAARGGVIHHLAGEEEALNKKKAGEEEARSDGKSYMAPYASDLVLLVNRRIPLPLH